MPVPNATSVLHSRDTDQFAVLLRDALPHWACFGHAKGNFADSIYPQS
jgi:hypothetical protein